MKCHMDRTRDRREAGSMYLSIYLSIHLYIHTYIPSRESSIQHLTIDIIDGGDGREHQVEDEEVPFQTVRDVVFAATRMAHGCV